MLSLKKSQFNLGPLPSPSPVLQPSPGLSSSHYVWSNPSVLGLQSRTPAPRRWDGSGEEVATSPTMQWTQTTFCYLYSTSHPLAGPVAWEGALQRLNDPQYAKIPSRYSCFLEDVSKLLQPAAQACREHELIPHGILQAQGSQPLSADTYGQTCWLKLYKGSPPHR